MGRRSGLVTAAAAAALVVIGIFGYSGHLPGPMAGLARHVGASSSNHQTTGPSGSGGGEEHGTSATPVATATGGTTARATALCQAYFKDPWRNGSRSWDRSDFQALSKAAGGAKWVLRYCVQNKYLTGSTWSSGHFQYPQGYEGGPWGWTPGQDSGQSHGGGNSQENSGSSQTTGGYGQGSR
jgi:hypothetical protein